MSNSKDMANNPVQIPRDEVEESRRKFIKLAGKCAIYTPPAVMLMMQPSRKVFANSSGGALSVGSTDNRKGVSN